MKDQFDLNQSKNIQQKITSQSQRQDPNNQNPSLKEDSSTLSFPNQPFNDSECQSLLATQDRKINNLTSLIQSLQSTVSNNNNIDSLTKQLKTLINSNFNSYTEQSAKSNSESHKCLLDNLDLKISSAVHREFIEVKPMIQEAVEKVVSLQMQNLFSERITNGLMDQMNMCFEDKIQSMKSEQGKLFKCFEGVVKQFDLLQIDLDQVKSSINLFSKNTVPEIKSSIADLTNKNEELTQKISEEHNESNDLIKTSFINLEKNNDIQLKESIDLKGRLLDLECLVSNLKKVMFDINDHNSNSKIDILNQLTEMKDDMRHDQKTNKESIQELKLEINNNHEIALNKINIGNQNIVDKLCNNEQCLIKQIDSKMDLTFSKVDNFFKDSKKTQDNTEQLSKTNKEQIQSLVSSFQQFTEDQNSFRQHNLSLTEEIANNCSVIPTMNDKIYEKNETVKLNSSLISILDERFDRITNLLEKQGMDVVSIKASQLTNPQIEQNIQQVHSTTRIQQIQELPEQIQSHLLLGTKLQSQMAEIIEDNQRFKVSLEKIHEDNKNASIEFSSNLNETKQIHVSSFKDILNRFNNMGDLMSKSLEYSKLVIEKVNQEMNKHTQAHTQGREEDRDFLKAFSQGLIQRFQESQLGALQMTQRLVEANKFWSDSTKEFQKTSLEKTDTFNNQLKANLDVLNSQITNYLTDFKVSNQKIIETCLDNQMCKIIELKGIMVDSLGKTSNVFKQIKDSINNIEDEHIHNHVKRFNKKSTNDSENYLSTDTYNSVKQIETKNYEKDNQTSKDKDNINSMKSYNIENNKIIEKENPQSRFNLINSPTKVQSSLEINPNQIYKRPKVQKIQLDNKLSSLKNEIKSEGRELSNERKRSLSKPKKEKVVIKQVVSNPDDKGSSSDLIPSTSNSNKTEFLLQQLQSSSFSEVSNDDNKNKHKFVYY